MPLKQIYFNALCPFVFLCGTITIARDSSRFLLVIDPAGDVHNPGRQLTDSFEHGPTIQCAETLKKQIESTYRAEVVLTRTPGSTTTQQQNAQLANRLNADLYLHLSFFRETQMQLLPRLCLYTFSYGNDFPLRSDTFTLCPRDQAHCYALETTADWATRMYDALADSPYALQQPIAIPHAQLIGIAIPAIGVEIGLHAACDWQQCVTVLVESIGTIITHIRP